MLMVLIKILGEEISEIDTKSSNIIANSSELKPKVEILKQYRVLANVWLCSCLAIQLGFVNIWYKV
ncbi:hypothetical protein MIDIC_460008 [Alphaproteobacteria bacterium]